jgi:hypothetical protein
MHQPTHGGPIGLAHTSSRTHRAANFTYDVPGSPVDQLPHFTFSVFELLDGHIAERFHAEVPCGFLTLCPSLSVFATAQLVLYVGIDNEQRDGRVLQRDDLGFPRTAVQQEQVTFASQCGNELVHDTTRDPCKVVLGLLAEQRFFDGIKSRTSNRFEQGRSADLESSAAAQAAAKRHGGMQKHVQAPWLDAASLKSGNNATRVIAPFRRTWYNGLGKINRRHLSL